MERASVTSGIEVLALGLGVCDAGGTALAVTLVDPPPPGGRLSRDGGAATVGGSPMRGVVTRRVGVVDFGRQNRSSI